MFARVTPERQPRQDIAHGRGKREAVAAEARRDQESIDAGHRPDQRNLVRRERFETGPAPRDRGGADCRIDGACDLAARADAVVEDFIAVFRFCRDRRGPSPTDQIRTVPQLLQTQLAIEAAHHLRERPWCRRR